MTSRTPISDATLRELSGFSGRQIIESSSVSYDTEELVELLRDEALARGEKIRELEQYIAWISRETEGPVQLAYAHGWRCDQAVYEKGKEWRARLGLPESYDDPLHADDAAGSRDE